MRLGHGMGLMRPPNLGGLTPLQRILALSPSGQVFLNEQVNPIHWFDFVNDRCLYASNDVGAVSGATGYSFSRASTGYYTNADGTLTSFASGALRRGDRGVLIEGARTNLCLQSQNVSAWPSPLGTCVVTSTTATAPDGTSTAAVLAGNDTYSNRINAASIPCSASTTYTMSIYVRRPSGTGTYRLSFASAGGTFTTTTSAAQTIGPTWTRLSHTFTTGVGNTAFFVILYGDTGVGDVEIWGAQAEAASFPSSYIPTTTASATRAADVLTFTPGVNWPLSLWVEFIRAVDTGTFETLIRLDNAGSNLQRSQINIGTSDDPTAFSNSGGSTGSVVVGTIPVSPTIVRKAAARFAVNNVNLSVGGINGTADTAVNAPTAPDRLIIGADSSSAGQFFGYIRRAAVFNSALSDANLQAVTT